MATKGSRALAARGAAAQPAQTVRQKKETKSDRQNKAIELAEKRAKKGMGFKAAAQDIARKQGVSYDRASAILAAGARKASPAAKRANPNLKKVTAAKKTSRK